MKNLTNEQSQLLIKVIDAKWDSNNLESYHERDIARQEYYNLKRQLVESMGLDEWIEWIESLSTGPNMFVSSKS